MLKKITVVLLVSNALLVSSCAQEASNKAPVAVPVTPSLELSATDVMTVKEQRLQKIVALTGQLQAFNYTTVQSEVNASVAHVLVREGQSVTKGQVLVNLSTQDLQSRLQQAQAALASAKAESILASAIKERNEQLYKERYIADIDYKRGIAEAAARAENVKAQESLVAIARKALADAVISSPMSGVIAKRHVQAGQTVSINSPLLDVVDLSQLELVASIAPEHVAALNVGQAVKFTVQGFAEQFSAQVTRVNPVADAATRAVTFYAQLQNPQQRLKAGLFVQGSLALGEAQQGLVVPKSAIHQLQNQYYVWVINQQKLVKRSVVLGLDDEQSGQAVISQGLQAGEQVVLAQLSAQAANMPIKMVE